MEGFTGKEYHEIAFTVLNSFLRDEIGNNDLMSLCRDAYNFKVPIEHVTGK